MRDAFVVLGFVLLPLLGLSQKGYEKDLAVADRYFELKEYANAIPFYERAYARRKEVHCARQIALSYNLLNEVDQALIWYRVLIKRFKSKTDYLGYGKVYMKKKKYTAAQSCFKRYLKIVPGDFEALNCLEGCVLGLKRDKNKVVVSNLRQINSPYSDVSAVSYGRDLVFSSSREGVLIKEKFGRTQEPFFNLYISQFRDGLNWGKPHLFSSEINSRGHEGAATFNATGDTIYFTRCEHKFKTKEGDSDVNPTKLFRSIKGVIGWSRPYYFMYNDSLNSYAHPCMSKSGDLFFFSSDMEGGFGGSDIYMCMKIDTVWSEAINLGPGVNTKGDEFYPFYNNDGVLYFSSTGHPGLGGLDIFKYNLEGRSGQDAENLGLPINSSMDDFSIYFLDEKTGYFTSNRPKGKGKEDIYSFKILGD